jgi:hypothetical protein
LLICLSPTSPGTYNLIAALALLAQEYAAKTTWLAANGPAAQAHTGAADIMLYGFCSFAMSCVIAWGVLGMGLGIAVILRSAQPVA